MLGKAVMVLSLDVDPEEQVGHDDWHTHEHLPERLSIPGFLRGSRWTALSGSPRYLILYEVADIAVLTSAPYLARLNNPTPGTSAIMKHYRGMSRGFCRVEARFGAGLGQAALLVRFSPVPGKESALQNWLTRTALRALPSQRGLASAYLLQSAVTPPMTEEQKIRGKDTAIDWVVLAAGYDAERVAALSENGLSIEQLEQHGAAPGTCSAIYRLDYSLIDREIAMASSKQKAAARRNIKKAAGAARKKRTIANLPKKTRTALGKQGAKIAKRKRK